MRVSRLTSVLAVSLMCTGAAFGQAKGHSTTPKKPAAAAPKADDLSAPTVKGQNGYPDMVQKSKGEDLCASTDYRGKMAPSFKVEHWITTKDAPNRANKTVLIDFWATWCPPCRALIPELNGYQEKFKDDLVVIGISDEKVDKLTEFVKTTKMNYAMGTDPSKSMENQIGIRAIPHVMVISSDGIVRWQGFPGASGDQLTEDKLKQIIEADKAARAAKKDSKDSKDTKDTSKPKETPKTPEKTKAPAATTPAKK